MLVFESKLEGNESQYRILDEILRTARFLKNKCLRHWIDNRGVSRLDLHKYCKILADDSNFIGIKKLNLMALQAMAERACSAIMRF
jgi:putative transposase